MIDIRRNKSKRSAGARREGRVDGSTMHTGSASAHVATHSQSQFTVTFWCNYYLIYIFLHTWTSPPVLKNVEKSVRGQIWGAGFEIFPTVISSSTQARV